MRSGRLLEDYLHDIADAAALANEFVRGMDFDTFRSATRTIFAVVHALEIIGEATKNVPADVRARYPHVP